MPGERACGINQPDRRTGWLDAVYRQPALPERRSAYRWRTAAQGPARAQRGAQEERANDAQLPTGRPLSRWQVAAMQLWRAWRSNAVEANGRQCQRVRIYLQERQQGRAERDRYRLPVSELVSALLLAGSQAAKPDAPAAVHVGLRVPLSRPTKWSPARSTDAKKPAKAGFFTLQPSQKLRTGSWCCLYRPLSAPLRR